MVLIKSNSGQLMLVSPQQAVTRGETTRPAVPANTQTVKICTMPVKFFSSLVFQGLSSYKNYRRDNSAHCLN